MSGPPQPSHVTSRQRDYAAAGYWTNEVLPDVVDRWCSAAPDHPAVMIADMRLSYAELAAAARRLAGGLARIGIGKGDVVGVQLPNLPDFITTYLALSMRGAVLQTIHMPYRAAELSFLLAHARAKAVVCMAHAKDFSAAETAVALKSSIPSLKHVVALGDPIDGAIGFGDLSAGADAVEPVAVVAADPLVLLYTSGTTADPKGVPHSHRGFLANARLSARELEIGADDVLLSLAPMSHLYGLFVYHIALMAGATVSLLPVFSPQAFADAVVAHRATKVFAAPAHLQATINMGLMDTHDFSSVRFVCLSGSTVPPALAKAVEHKLPQGKSMQLWGMSELQAGSYSRMSDAAADRHYTAGRASPGTELRVVDDAGRPVPAETDGRLQVRGPSLFAGYLDNDAATAAAFATDGWFETGDTAKLTVDGHLILTGRVKEIINRGGVKYNPLDIEIVLDAMPGVERSAVVPYPDAVLGEKACAFVVPAAGADVTLADIAAALEAAGVARFKWPERLQLIEALPMTPTQKVMRGRLTALLEDDQGTAT